jgi:hypothetical protein
MTTPTPNDLPRELLAAYADGELDEATRASVERWLAGHPDARNEVQAQRELGPANAGLWERAEPPEPSEGQWAWSRRQIESRLSAPEPSSHRWRGAWAVAAVVSAGIAAALAWVAFAPVRQPPREGDPRPNELARAPEVAPSPREVAQLSPPGDPLAGIAVLAMATDDDVVLERVPDFPAGFLLAGRHPLEGVMFLATEAELRVAEFTPSAAFPTGRPKMTTAPGDAPMLYAPKFR